MVPFFAQALCDDVMSRVARESNLLILGTGAAAGMAGLVGLSHCSAVVHGDIASSNGTGVHTARAGDGMGAAEVPFEPLNSVADASLPVVVHLANTLLTANYQVRSVVGWGLCGWMPLRCCCRYRLKRAC